MTKEELEVTSKEALERLEHVLNWDGDLDIDKDLYKIWVNLICKTIEKDLNRLEKLEKENQELKEKVNHFEKVIEDMKNMPDCDFKKALINNNFKYMFSNCKLKPLTEKKEHKMTSKEALSDLLNMAKLYKTDVREFILENYVEEKEEQILCNRYGSFLKLVDQLSDRDKEDVVWVIKQRINGTI